MASYAMRRHGRGDNPEAMKPGHFGVDATLITAADESIFVAFAMRAAVWAG
jgi:hypothetical protein